MLYKVTDAEADGDSSNSINSGASKKRECRSPLSCSFLLAFGLSLILAGVCCCAAVLFFIGNQKINSCVTEECVQTASRILKAMDRSVEPCQDFYSFACGGWQRKNPVPEWSTTWDQLAKLRETLSRDLRELLEDPDTDELPKSVKKAKALYRTCMDVAQIERDGIEPIKKTLEMLGMTKYPPKEVEAKDEHFIWQRSAGRARRLLGLSAMIGLHVTEDVRNTSRNRLVIEQVSPGFSEKYLNSPDKFAHEIEQYRKYISAMIKTYEPDADAELFAADIITFSTEIATIMTPTEVRRSGTHLFHEVTVSQLYEGASGGPEAWKDLKFEEFIKYAFENTNVTFSVTEDRVIVMDLPYLQRLSLLLTATDHIVIEKFVWWSVFSTIAPLTKSVFKDLGFAFSKEVFGLQQKTARWKSCTANVNANFGIALSYLYVTKHFDKDSRENAIGMLEDVRKAFSEAVMELDWMDNTTRIKTINKLKAIRNYVGFPAWLLTTKQLDAKYNKTEIVEGKLFDTYLKLTNGSVKKNLESLREKPDRNRWVATPTTVNAFYSATLNSVTFPAGILQPPFYGNGLESINYGSIGAIMGHEVTHGFDDQGRRYDEKGNLKQWWSAATLEHYHEKVQCIIDQYNKYHMAQLPNYTVHGFNTQGENIADNGGLRAALNAYKLFTIRDEQANKQRLPSMEKYSQEQLFFLGFAQIWCGNSTIGALKSKLVEGVHSPNRIRVIGTLSNSKEFSDAWNCPAGSPMNPRHKCILW